MLEDSLFESVGQNKTRNPLLVVVSVAAHAVTLFVLVLIPLLHTQALPIPKVDTSLFLPRMEPHHSIPVFASRPRNQANNRPGPLIPTILTAPRSIPSHIPYATEPPTADIPFSFGPGGAAGLPARLGTDPIEIGPPPTAPTALPPPLPAPLPAVRVTRIRQGTGVQAARLIHQVQPAYPPLARQVRIQGIVVLEAVISKEGSITSLRVVSGHPLLTESALDAVKQWRYEPTLLNGDPVEVVTTVTVTFTMR
jgi:protein TonB